MEINQFDVNCGNLLADITYETFYFEFLTLPIEAS